ncbi:hypothetical protein [Lysinibacillus sphaericus]|uniref:Uncharacterized protein n=1 Tax=Lysinibacillus sphaericus OT4b.31 TaxID=1285586 RepID=R7Z993_LYSSH|nr:hypothetical protein [Lysinibacillus sphaericus]EON70579.1 hypothetical protein H131_21092 [Lysinibacillus sphaericus OT4b.31]
MDRIAGEADRIAGVTDRLAGEADRTGVVTDRIAGMTDKLGEVADRIAEIVVIFAAIPFVWYFLSKEGMYVFNVDRL